MPTVADIFGQHIQAPKSKGNGDYVCPLLMGIEVEVERFSSPSDVSDKVLKTWNCIPDHSLRNNGIEFVLKNPLQGVELEESISTLEDCLRTASFELTHRCSVHVHLDFRNTEISVIESFFMLYMLLEPSLYTISSKDRYNNIYCPGLTHTTELIKTAAVGFAGNDISQLVSRWNKYTGINLCPLSSMGSIEIRTHAGTGSGEEIAQWTQVLNALYQAATVLTIDEINKLSSPAQLIATVFPEKLHGVVSCENLYKFWESAKINLMYFNTIKTIVYDANKNQSIPFGSLNNDALTGAFVRELGEF